MFIVKKLARSYYVPAVLPILTTLFVVCSLILPSTSHAYVTYQRWPGNSSEWRNYISGAPFPANPTTLVDAAAQKWSKPATGKNFDLYNYQNVSGAVRVSTNAANFAASGLPDIPARTFRLSNSAGQLSSSTVYVNNTWTWNTSCTHNMSQKNVDFRVIILHELGHSVGLDHDPNQTAAVMWPDFTCKLNLQTDDLNGIGALYP